MSSNQGMGRFDLVPGRGVFDQIRASAFADKAPLEATAS